MNPRWSAAAIAAAVLAACETPPYGAQDWTVRDSAGVTIVTNHPLEPARGCIEIATPAEVVIRSGDGTNPGSLPPLIQVRGGTLLPDGRTVVLAAGTWQILFYDAEGRFQHAVGRNGQGPGEFIRPTWLGSGRGDTLFIWDASQRRLTILDGTGTLLTTQKVDGAAEHPDIGGRFGDGSFLMRPGGAAFFPRTSDVVRLEETYGRHDPSTGVTTLLAAGKSREMALSETSGRYGLPFGRATVVAANRDHLILADTGEPELRFHDLNGQVRRIVRWTSPPIPVTAQDRTDYAVHYAAESPRFAPPPDAEFARERPRLTSIITDHMGWIWVKRYSGGWEEPPLWLVFDERGVLRCEIEPPARLLELEIGADYLLSLQRDSTGEETVMRWGLRRRVEAVTR